jgi:adenine-specific DNA-methyltransferase
MDGNSLNITQDLLEKLKELVPQAFSEEKLDLQKFQTLLGEAVNTDNERYQLSWAGKSEAYKVLQMPTTATLIPQPEQSVNWDESENIFIEGENLEVLKVLQKSYYGKIKMIYIDPPYNTGKDSFIYPDKFSETKEEYLKRIGEKDEEGYMMKEGLFRKNSKENGQFHSNWLNMMLPRLFLARNLLKEDGVIFVSIDDNEQANLKLLLDEIFGEDNFIGQLIIQTATDNNPTQINTEHEYMLCYSKNKSLLEKWGSRSKHAEKIQEKYQELKLAFGSNIEKIQLELREWIRKNKTELPKVTHYDNVDERGVFHDGDVANTRFGGYEYDIPHPVTGKPCKIPPKGFRFPEETILEMIERGDIMFGEDENTLIKPKKRLEDAKDILRTLIYEDGRASTKVVDELVGRSVFDNPKSHFILARLISFVCKDNDIVLDFFAGSASTVHAVFDYNEEENKNVKFICVQLPELVEKGKEADKAGYKTISEVAERRISRVIEQINAERNGKIEFERNQTLGFRKYTLSPSNFKIWRGDLIENEAELTKQMELFVTPQRANAQSENILWELLIKNGVPL